MRDREETILRVEAFLSKSIDEIIEAFERGELTAEEITQACLDRIERFNPRYKAVILPNPDALRDAREIDLQRAEGRPLGRLAGIPVVIKDPMDVKGIPTTAGWWLLHAGSGGIDVIPEEDAPVVARMRAAGAIILGKTNIPVMSANGEHTNNSWAGSTVNAATPDFVPGASSAGTATAVAARMAVIGLAEETGGSIQNPAIAQNLVGIKPTFGLVPTAGVFPLSGLRDVIGPIATNVRDAAVCLDVISGYTSEDPKTMACVGRRPADGYTSRLAKDALKGKRLGLYGPGWRNATLAPETSALYRRAQEEVAALGATLIEDPFKETGIETLAVLTPPFNAFDGRGLEHLPWDLQNYFQRLGKSASIKSYKDFVEATKKENYLEFEELTYLPNLDGFAECLADPTRAPDQTGFIQLREKYLSIVQSVFSRHSLDGLVYPHALGEIPSIAGEGSIKETTVSEINIAGLPAVTVPAGAYSSGSLFGLLFIGRMWSEADLLAYAFAYEQETSYYRPAVLKP